jgi:hypothetical protein
MFKKILYLCLAGSFALAACSSSASSPTDTAQPVNTTAPQVNASATTATTATSPAPTDTLEPTATETPTITPTVEVKVTTAVPNPDPLTGKAAESADVLNRRPVLVKVENLPRSDRPQWGLTLADLVYEYHTEEGTTRFGAIYYGNNAEQVGPIRSGRIFDIQLVDAYKAIFVFSGAYVTVMDRFYQSNFSNRLVTEGPADYPALYRYEPNGRNFLMVNTNLLNDVLAKRGINNSRQDVSGMTFQETPPAGGTALNQIYVRYSSAIYNRWDYDAASGRYLRYSDTQNAYSQSEEKYAQLTDSLTNQPVAAENIVMVLAQNVVVSKGIYDILLYGSGTAYIARDGQIYQVLWERQRTDSILTLVGPDGKPFPFKPGQTWFEVLSDPTDVIMNQDNWRFVFHLPQ